MPTTATADPCHGQNKLFMSYAATGEDGGGNRIHHFLSKGHYCLLRTLANFRPTYSWIRFHPVPDRLKPTANTGNPIILFRPTPRLSPFSSLIKSVSPSSVARWDFAVASSQFRRRPLLRLTLEAFSREWTEEKEEEERDVFFWHERMKREKYSADIKKIHFFS